MNGDQPVDNRAWMNRLGKWRTIFAGWQLGTRVKGDPEGDAVRDHREATLLLRAEVSALSAILVSQGVVTADTLVATFEDEARYLCNALTERFPGVVAVDDGLNIDTAKMAEWAKDWRP